MNILSAEETERRLHRISQMRAMILEMKFAAREAYERGELPICPIIDPRSDIRYWRKVAAERGIQID